MNIKATISEFELYQHTIDSKVKNLKIIFQNEDKFWKLIKSLDPEIVISERIMNVLADSLQMVNDDAILKTFELKDIKAIYQLLVQYYPDNIQYRIDLIAFVFNILNDEKEAYHLIDATTKLIEEKKKVLDGFMINRTI